MGMEQWVLVTEALTKRYDDFVAVDNLNLQVKSGEVFGLLGPNGAGKTTTILMTLGLTEPSAGRVQVLGLDPARQPLSVKARVGYLPDQVGFYDELNALENLLYIARLNGLRRDEAYRRMETNLARMGLSEVAHNLVATYSRGMRQRLGVAELLLKAPRLIIMDEPTNGLDPEAARAFLQLIRELKEEGITIILSSHQLHQVQAVCDRVGLFHHGKMVLQGTVDELAQRVLAGAYRIHLRAEGDVATLTAALRQTPGVIQVSQHGPLNYTVEARQDLRGEVARTVIGAGAQLLAFDMEAPSLDDIYAQYFKEVQDGRTN
jgi:ABC-2 type transport system ATP-binding protein